MFLVIYFMKNILDNYIKELSPYSDIPNVLELMAELISWVTDNISHVFELAQSAERLLKIIHTWAYKNNNLLEQLQNTKDPLRAQASEAFFTKEQAYIIAQNFCSSHIDGHSLHSVLRVTHISKPIAEAIVDIFSKKWMKFDAIDFYEPYFNATLFQWTWDFWFEALQDRRIKKLSSINSGIFLNQYTPSDYHTIYSYEARLLNFKFQRVWFDNLSESMIKTTTIPSVMNANIDEISYDKYLNLYFEACDQPWDEIKKAQEILIEQFDLATDLRIKNADGTDVHFDISWMTFVNFTDGNVPWSEIFSAPKREWVQWKIVAKWKFSHSSDIITNITLDDIKDGQIHNYFAEENDELFKSIIVNHPGSDYIGEIGIWTNPHLQQHLVNNLLVEKIWWSFHVALWYSFIFDHYDGKPVHVDNGNRSTMHRDITAMLRWQESHIMLDGKILQKNGKWLDPRVSVLNEGWWTLPIEQQPDWRKKNYPHGYT